MTPRRCAYCKHWASLDTPGIGQCTIQPLKIISDPTSDFAQVFYGVVYPNGVCEEWKEKEQERQLQ